MIGNRASMSQTRGESSVQRTRLWLFAALGTGLLVLGVYFTVDFATHPPPSSTAGTPVDAVRKEVSRPQSVREVQTLIPQRRDLTYAIRLPATLSPIAQVTIYSKVSGYLKSIAVDKGDRVKAGQVLAVIDAPELKQRYEQARSTYRIKQVTYTRLRNVWEEDPDIIAKQDVDVAEAAYWGAKHALEQLAAELEYAKVRAPFSGTITARFVDVGAMIQSATSSATQTLPLFTLMDMSTIRVYASVPQEDVSYVDPGVRASITIAELPEKDFQGEVTRTTGALDPTTRTMLVEIHVPNPEHQLQPGMFATATLYLQEHRNALALPPAALTTTEHRATRSSVFVVAQGKVRQVPVRTGLDDGVWIEILDGLTGQEEVVVVGKSGLTDGQAVRASPYTLPAGKPARQKY